MKPLISTDSPTYLRRLVRELNQYDVNGFYAIKSAEPGRADCVRCVRARLHKGTLQVLRWRNGVGEWFVPGNYEFVDGNGGGIHASRH